MEIRRVLVHDKRKYSILYPLKYNNLINHQHLKNILLPKTVQENDQLIFFFFFIYLCYINFLFK